jgi:hypothetical protein
VRRNKRISGVRSNRAADGSVVIVMNRRNRASIEPALQQAFSRINDPPWNKPNITGSAWQVRHTSVLGRRTEAGRL